MTRIVFTSIAVLASINATILAQTEKQTSNEPMSLQESKTTVTETTTSEKIGHEDEAYKEVSDFFNIREANASLKCGEWEFEMTTLWSTYYSSAHHDDNIGLEPSIKYGITDELFVELEVLPINLGDGEKGTGNGDLAFQLFWQFLKEQDWVPAMAIWAETRLPTGVGSEKMDAELHLNITHHICDHFRAHLEGFLETANGWAGDPDVDPSGEEDDRRHFQWGVGPGFDYQLNPCNMLILNWLNKSNDLYGLPNNNIVELGWVYEINDNQHLKAAVDAETHERTEDEHWTAKLQWSIEW